MTVSLPKVCPVKSLNMVFKLQTLSSKVEWQVRSLDSLFGRDPSHYVGYYHDLTLMSRFIYLIFSVNNFHAKKHDQKECSKRIIQKLRPQYEFCCTKDKYCTKKISCKITQKHQRAKPIGRFCPITLNDLEQRLYAKQQISDCTYKIEHHIWSP